MFFELEMILSKHCRTEHQGVGTFLTPVLIVEESSVIWSV